MKCDHFAERVKNYARVSVTALKCSVHLNKKKYKTVNIWFLLFNLFMERSCRKKESQNTLSFMTNDCLWQPKSAEK